MSKEIQKIDFTPRRGKHGPAMSARQQALRKQIKKNKIPDIFLLAVSKLTKKELQGENTKLKLGVDFKGKSKKEIGYEILLKLKQKKIIK